ncbi:MAG TPA: Kae1-associated kinase Bud32 [Methanosarcinaceae archaeon]|nr:Kae1-associated kinase Bud32 [Methanosarcinaceae archaeon]
MYLTSGAEATVHLEDDVIIKERVPKRYRLVELDRRIRKERTRAEARLMSEARRVGVPTPIIYDVNGSTIKMEYIGGIPVKNVMSPELSERVGEIVGRLHSGGIIHGDLTTSNMILHNNRIFLIDFGLAFVSNIVESHGVDVHVLFQTFESTHKDHERLIETFCKGYRKTFKDADEVLKRVKEIEKRGRYA